MASYSITQHPETHDFYPTAVLRDIPTDVPTTTVALAADDDADDDRDRSCPSIATDVIFTIDPTFLQEWDAFYLDFLDFVNSTGANANTSKHEPAGAVVATNDPPAAADPNKPRAIQQSEDLHSEPTNLLQSPTTFPPRITVHTDTSTTFATSADFVVNDSTTDDSDHLDPQHNEITSNDHASDDRHNDDRAINDGDINNKDNRDTAEQHDNDRANDQ